MTTQQILNNHNIKLANSLIDNYKHFYPFKVDIKDPNFDKPLSALFKDYNDPKTVLTQNN